MLLPITLLAPLLTILLLLLLPRPTLAANRPPMQPAPCPHEPCSSAPSAIPADDAHLKADDVGPWKPYHPHPVVLPPSDPKPAHHELLPNCHGSALCGMLLEHGDQKLNYAAIIAGYILGDGTNANPGIDPARWYNRQEEIACHPYQQGSGDKDNDDTQDPGICAFIKHTYGAFGRHIIAKAATIAGILRCRRCGSVPMDWNFTTGRKDVGVGWGRGQGGELSFNYVALPMCRFSRGGGLCIGHQGFDNQKGQTWLWPQTSAECREGMICWPHRVKKQRRQWEDDDGFDGDLGEEEKQEREIHVAQDEYDD